jgi:hypothetical protein
MDAAWGRHSCPIEEVEYEAFFGQRYKKDTEIGYLVDYTTAAPWIKILEDVERTNGILRRF